MNKAQKMLLFTGLALISFTMAYGVYYALFDEHQTLQGMGLAMTEGFVQAAQGDLAAAFAALDSFGVISAEYGTEVHAHGHWGMLALILIVLGLNFDRLALSAGRCVLLAVLLSASAFFFPLGVLLQSTALAGFGKLLSIGGSGGMIVGLLLSAWSLWRAPASEESLQ